MGVFLNISMCNRASDACLMHTTCSEVAFPNHKRVRLVDIARAAVADQGGTLLHVEKALDQATFVNITMHKGKADKQSRGGANRKPTPDMRVLYKLVPMSRTVIPMSAKLSGISLPHLLTFHMMLTQALLGVTPERLLQRFELVRSCLGNTCCSCVCCMSSSPPPPVPTSCWRHPPDVVAVLAVQGQKGKVAAYKMPEMTPAVAEQEDEDEEDDDEEEDEEFEVSGA